MEQTFIHKVTDELIRRFGWNGLKDVTLVFPMHRAGVVLRNELQRRMATEHPTALWAPEMLALGDLFDSLCPLGKEDELFTVCRLHRIYSECLKQTAAPTSQTAWEEVDAMEIDRFYGWGRQLLSDFTNIDQGISENELESFFRNALTLSDLDTYKLDEEVRQRLEDLLYKGEARQHSLIAKSVQAHFAALWHAMPAIYHRLRDELQQAGKGYEGQRMRYVISHWHEVRKRATSKTYCFIGFNYLLPVERQLMQHLQDEGRAIFFWDYVADFRTNSKAFAFIRQNMLTMPNALPVQQWGGPRHIKAVSATSAHAEAEFAGQWLQQTYKQKGESTAVIICDEGQLEPVIYSLPPICLEGSDIPEDINITKGYPLRNTPVFAEIILQLEQAFHKLSASPVQVLQDTVKFVDSLSGQSIASQQNTWQWHMQREALYQTRRTLIQFINILQENVVGDLLAHTDLLVRLIRRHLEQITLPFHGEPVTDMQIMGVLETRTLDFEHLLLLNVEEGVIPAHQPDKSFLPYYLRKAYGLQTHDERASVYAYNFFRLLNRAKDVTLVFSQSQTAMTKKTMSRFIMQMLICPDEFVVEKHTLTESNTLQPARTIEVPKDASWVASALNRLSSIANDHKPSANLYLSPSAINTFYTCKRKFYYEYMMGLHVDDELEMVFSNRTLGLFVHEAIHYMYEHYCHCDNHHAVRITPNQIEQLNTPERRREALLVSYEHLNSQYMHEHDTKMPAFIYERHKLENRVIDTYIEHILDRDCYDAGHSGLSILLLEYPLYKTVERGVWDGQEFCIKIGGRLDRMDCIGGLYGLPEITRIVDYKCGKYNEKKMSANTADLRQPEKADVDYVRQTLLYSYISYNQLIDTQGTDSRQPSIEPHLYFASQDMTKERTTTRVSLDKTPIVYNSTTHEQFAELIHAMVQDILHERQFTQCEKCSPYCPFLHLCGRKASKF